ncbi:MAG: ATP-binding protein [Acidimicrobiia bacterium]|nr:ATP-binding protein [Acidimicrobiia bacterium]
MSEPRYVREVPWRQGGQPVSVLPAAGLFGANGSGKSTVLRIMDDMRSHVVHSFRHGNPDGGIQRRPFLLDARSKASPSRLEVELVLDGVRVEYGFAVDDDRVTEEWAYRYPKGRAALVLHRHGDEVELGASDRPKGRAVMELLRPNALFLPTAAAANRPTLLPLVSGVRCGC